MKLKIIERIFDIYYPLYPQTGRYYRHLLQMVQLLIRSASKEKEKWIKKNPKSSLSFHSSWRWKQGWRSIEDATEEGSSWSPIRVQSSQSQDGRVSSSRKKRDTPFDQSTKYDIITRHSLPSLLVSYFGLLLGQSSRSKLLDNIYTGTN